MLLDHVHPSYVDDGDDADDDVDDDGRLLPLPNQMVYTLNNRVLMWPLWPLLDDRMPF